MRNFGFYSMARAVCKKFVYRNKYEALKKIRFKMEEKIYFQ